MDSTFRMPKDLRVIRPGAPNAGGWVEMGDFRQIAGYLENGAWLVLKSNRKSYACALSNGGIAHDHECPVTALNQPIFCILQRHS